MNITHYNVHIMNSSDKEDSITLDILETIENQSNVTQRLLADSLGIALGLANSYLKRCVRKGLIKIKQVPANRYLYYLTPKGFTEKSRLTAKFLSSSFDFYRRASRAYTSLMEQSMARGHGRVILCGLSELAEIASLRAQEYEIEVVGIYEPDTKKEKHLGIPIWHEISKLPAADCLVLSAINNTGEIYRQIKDSGGDIPVVVPEILAYAVHDHSTPVAHGKDDVE